jgi:AbrB family looped-hinge helix DNA binding protein
LFSSDKSSLSDGVSIEKSGIVCQGEEVATYGDSRSLGRAGVESRNPAAEMSNVKGWPRAHMSFGERSGVLWVDFRDRLIYRFTHYRSMEVSVETVTVSSKYQIVIPRRVRESLKLRPGVKIQVLQYEDRIELIPLKKPSEMRGFLKGIDTTVERDKDRV